MVGTYCLSLANARSAVVLPLTLFVLIYSGPVPVLVLSMLFIASVSYLFEVFSHTVKKSSGMHVVWNCTFLPICEITASAQCMRILLVAQLSMHSSIRMCRSDEAGLHEWLELWL